MTPEETTELGRRLHDAWNSRTPIAPLTESTSLASVDDAYAIQSAWAALQLADGDRIVGRKIGLTSRAVQEQMGVDEPDYGTLWVSRHVEVDGGRGEIAAATFLQPRVEGELAFLLGDPPQGPDVTAEDVLAATEAVAASIEIVDSRIQDWRIALADTVADNASFGAFAVGPWTPLQDGRDLPAIGMTMTRNGETVGEGVGSAALGDPAFAVAWLLNKLSSFGVQARRGDIVISGALAATVPAAAGDVFRLEMDGEAPLELAFT
jgi:2-keto-4-pentenoate hydratase